MEFKIPQTLKREHQELHAFLEKTIKLPGKTGEAAKEVATLMHPHFIKEEALVLPPLGLLPLLVQGKVTADMKEVITLTDKLKNELPEMLVEHQLIVASLQTLVEKAVSENHPEVVSFANKLMLHAQTEEEVSYPTAILVGEYLKLKLRQW